MPRPPNASPAAAAIKGSVYSSLLHKLATHTGEVYPLHVGDTWKLPPEGCRVGNLKSTEHKGLNQYTAPQGMPALVDAVLERAAAAAPTERGQVVITGGATAGLAAAVGSVVSPGDEVLILAPHWPLIDGIVRMFGGRPVPVPFLGVVDSPEFAVAAVRASTTPRTVALYVNTPNNPTGHVIPRPWLEVLAEWARKQNLWLLFDEVYEDYQYEGAHTPGRPLAPERAFSLHSFSKAFGMAGNRCGWIVGPVPVMSQVLKLHTHTTYSAPTASQVVALGILQGAGVEWLKEARDDYREAGRGAAAILGLPEPEGSTFLFLDVGKRLGEGGLMPFLEACANEGLFLAPGPSFGPYPTHVRICYTAARPEVVMRGVEILAGKLGLR